MTVQYAPTTFFPRQFLGTAGQVLSGGTLEAFNSDTDLATEMFSDKDGTSLGTSITLSDAGYTVTSTKAPTIIYIDPNINTKFVLRDSGGVAQWTVPNLSALLQTEYDSVASALADNLVNQNFVDTTSYYGGWAATLRGPKGGGRYFSDGTTGTASTMYTNLDGFYDSEGKGFRLYLDGKINVFQTGAKGDGDTIETDDTLAFNSSINALVARDSNAGTVFAEDFTYIVSDDATNLEANNTGIRIKNNITLEGASEHGTIIKMADGAVNDTHVVRAAAGASIPWNTTRISNVAIKNLTIDGNRSGHSVVTASDGVTTASSANISSASGMFATASVGDFVRMDLARSSYSITNVTPSGSSAIIEVVGHDFRVGERINVDGMTATGDYDDMNGQNFSITAVTKTFDEVWQSVTVTKTLSSGSYTSGGTVVGGRKHFAITTVTDSNNVVLNETVTLTTASNNFTLEKGENGWGIQIVGCDGIKVKDVTIKNCWGDGIYVDNPFGSSSQLDGSTLVDITRVDCFNNRRQGISLVACEGVTITNSKLRSTGIDGVGPGAGIDLEPDSGLVRDITITDNQITDNIGPGLTSNIAFTDTSGTPLVLEAADKYGTWDIVIKGNHFLRNQRYGASFTGMNEGVVFESNIVKYNRRGGVRARGSSTGKVSQQWKIINNHISWNQYFGGSDGDVDNANNGHGIVMHNGANNILMQSIMIAGNSIEYNDGHGVVSSGLIADFVYIKDNDAIVGNGQRLDDTYSNVKVEGTQSIGLQITGNRIDKGATAANTHPFGVSSGFKAPRYGIEVTSGTSYDTLIENNNVAAGGETANMAISNNRNVTGGARNVIRNNPGYKTETTIFTSALNSATTNATNAPQTSVKAHGLDITPLARHCKVSVADDISGTPMTTVPIFQIEPYVSAIDGTNVTVSYGIATGGVGNFIVNVDIRGDNAL